MTPSDVILDVFCRVDDRLRDVPKHPQAQLGPREVVTLALVFARKGVGPRPFYRWRVRHYADLFPHLPARTRLWRWFKSPWRWRDACMEAVTWLGVIDT